MQILDILQAEYEADERTYAMQMKTLRYCNYASLGLIAFVIFLIIVLH